MPARQAKQFRHAPTFRALRRAHISTRVSDLAWRPVRPPKGFFYSGANMHEHPFVMKPELAGSVAERAIYGVATDDEAIRFAAIVSHDASAAFLRAARANIDAIGRAEARALLDEVEHKIDSGNRIAEHVFAHYPAARRILCDAISVLRYAHALIVPALLLGNADANGQGNQMVNTYIVRHGISGLIKIGKSVNVVHRVRALETGAGCDLITLAVVRRDVERELHDQFSDLRVFGEWFRDDGRIEDYARSVRDAA